MTNELQKNQTTRRRVGAESGETPLLRGPLRELAQRANVAHAQVLLGARTALQGAAEAGKALAEAKRICPLRKWLRWLDANFEGSRRTAARYMAFERKLNHAGGVDGTELTHLGPREEESIYARLLVPSSGPKKRKAKVRPELAAMEAVAKEDPLIQHRELFRELLHSLCDESNGQDLWFMQKLYRELRPMYTMLVQYINQRRWRWQ
jgi:hypothetical protein